MREDSQIPIRNKSPPNQSGSLQLSTHSFIGPLHHNAPQTPVLGQLVSVDRRLGTPRCFWFQRRLGHCQGKHKRKLKELSCFLFSM